MYLYEAFVGWVVPSLLRTAAGRVTALQTFPNQIFSADFPGKFNKDLSGGKLHISCFKHGQIYDG